MNGNGLRYAGSQHTNATGLVLRINGANYGLALAGPAGDIQRFFTLDRPSGSRYYLRDSVHGMVTCTCADYAFRHAGTMARCKHGQALVDAGLVTR